MEITPTGGVDPETKRANLRLLIAMIVFAVGLTALCIIWMHFHSERVNSEQPKGLSLRIQALDSQPLSC